MPHILLVDADKHYRETCASYLNSFGHSTAEAASAQTAIAVCEQKKPDLIVLDLQLVGHSGVEFLHELRSYAEWQNLPVLLLSSVPDQTVSGLKTAWRTLGVVGYLHKPETSLKKLQSYITNVLAVNA